MSFIEKYAEENHLSAYFVVLMKRMELTSVEDFCNLTARRRKKVLLELAVQVKKIASDVNDSYHKHIKQHLIETFGCFKYENYVAPIGVKIKLDGK